MTSLADRIVQIHDALEQADVPHAFGGALALAFHVEEPRATRDIDVNLFVAPVHAARVFAALPDGVSWTQSDVEEAIGQGQVRLFWDDTPIDCFFSTHAFHDVAALSAVTVPFERSTLPVLSANALAVFKAFFDRTRDWADIEAMIAVRAIDVPDVLGWLVELLGPDDTRVRRFRQISATESRG
jgi:hypothetical protein